MPPMSGDALSSRLRSLLGPEGWRDDPETLAPALVDSRAVWCGRCRGLALPADAAQTAAVLRLCAEAGAPVTPQGGNTGRCGGATPDCSGAAVLVNLRRMARIRDLDLDANAITVDAGCILQTVQEAARRAGRLFPLALGAQGSCQIGGNLATNAGGLHVLRYGAARALTLGLEVALPDGRVWDGLRALPKDNAGYDLKQVFIGSEGTLGMITAATLRLFPALEEEAVALCALDSVSDAVTLLTCLRAQAGALLTALELISAIAVDSAVRFIPGTRSPFAAAPPPWVVLVALSGTPEERARDRLESVLERAWRDGVIRDAALAASEAQGAAFWRLREAVVAAQPHLGASLKHDIAVPTRHLAVFLDRAAAAIAAICPDARPYPFGHLGDGNLHYNVAQPLGETAAAFLARGPALAQGVHDLVVDLKGSFAAEHGIGQERLPEMARYKSVVELELMRRIKHALDPTGTMNPGKVLPPLGGERAESGR